MGFNLFFWIEIITIATAFFLGLLMLMSHARYSKKYSEGMFMLLGYVFMFIVLKSIIYIAMDFSNVVWQLSNADQELPNQFFELMQPKYNFKFFIWQIVETVFIIFLSFSFILRRKSVEVEKITSFKIIMWVQVVVVLLIGAGVYLMSTQLEASYQYTASKVMDRTTYGAGDFGKIVYKEDTLKKLDTEEMDPEDKPIYGSKPIAGKDDSEKLFQYTVKSYEIIDVEKAKEDDELKERIKPAQGAFTFFTGPIGRGIFSIWKIVMLIMAWLSISSIYGYIGKKLRYISKYKKMLYVFLAIEIVFYGFAMLVPIYSAAAWFIADMVAVVLLAVFAYNVHSQFIFSIEDSVVALRRDKQIIIDLMRDISNIVGSGTFELDTIIKEIVEASVKGASAQAGAILIKDSITNRLNVEYVHGMYPPTKPFKIVSGMALNETVIVEKFRTEKIAVGEGLLGKVAEEGISIHIPDCHKDDTFVQTISDIFDVTSFIAVPLKSQEDVFGVLSIVDDSTTFMEADLTLIETLGEQAAITIQQIKMYKEILDKKQAEKELGVAGEIQASLVPHSFPDSGKYDLYAFSIPAKGVGGDYYDYIDFGNNKIAVTMFDVSGKGVPASLIMVMIRSILRAIASLDEDTREVCTKLNNTISEEIVEDRYATGFYLLFDAERGIMSYTNAGHGPLVLYRKSRDEFEFLDTDGMPVGIMAGVEYGQDYTTLEKGDIAMLYTDGISEAMNLTHEEYGMDRMYQVIRENKGESAQFISNKMLESVNRFVGRAPQHDDETLLIMKMK